MSTPHNQANQGDIAKTVLLPGDPLRAKVIAQNFLEDVVCFNTTRNMLGYTGNYKGTRVSVMGTGMGCPSIGIYTHELIHEYGVKTLIRIGSCGATTTDLKLSELVFAMGACTDSNYAHQYNLPGTFSAIASYPLLRTAVSKAEELNVPYHVGNVITSDLFYTETPEWKEWAKMGALAVEMETYALYCNAARAGVCALGIFSVSDSVVTGEGLSAEERQNSFTNMMKVALETAKSLS
jgi:purine-nucleoside phosphorylase